MARSPLRIAIANATYNGLLLLAQHEGYFRDEGLDVELVMRSSGRVALKSMLAGEADIAAAGQAPVALQLLIKHNELRVFTELSTASSSAILLANRRSGIRSERDLVGHTIGVTAGTSAEFQLNLFFAVHEIDVKTIKIVYLEQPFLLAAMESGQIDAAMIWEARAAEVLERQANQFVEIDANSYPMVIMLLSSREFIAEHKESMRRLLRALLRAAEFVQDEPRAFRRILESRVPLPEGPLTERLWARYRFHVGLSSVLLTLLSEDATWFAKQKYPAATPVVGDLAQNLDSSFLMELRPESVTYK